MRRRSLLKKCPDCYADIGEPCWDDPHPSFEKAEPKDRTKRKKKAMNKPCAGPVGHSILCVKHVVSTMADASETDAWLHRSVDMPSPPAPGSYVTDGAWECQAHEVAWFSNLGQYVAFDSPDTELRDAHLNQKHHHRSVEEIVSDWVEGGWEYLGRGATLMDAMLDAARLRNTQERDDTADPKTVRNAHEIEADGS